MARPLKDGVDYFPKNTDFYNDDKVKLLRVEFGAKGMYLLDYLLCEIYGKNGYFIKWDKSRCFLVSDGAGCGCSPEYISEFISGALRCSFFDERVFKVFGVLTSAGIQRRYLRMFGRREQITIIEEYWLLDMNDINDVPAGVLNKVAFKKVSAYKNPVSAYKNPDNVDNNSQNKVKQNKVKQNKREGARESTSPPTLEQVEEFFKKEKIKINAKKFFYYYNAKNWHGISDWKSKVREWQATEKQSPGEAASYDLELFKQMLDAKE